MYSTFRNKTLFLQWKSSLSHIGMLALTWKSPLFIRVASINSGRVHFNMGNAVYDFGKFYF